MKTSEVTGAAAHSSSLSQSQGKTVQEKAEIQSGQAAKTNKGEEVSREKVEEAVEKMNKAVETIHEDLQFQLHDETDIMMAKLVNLEKHETIKEMPPKEILDMLGQVQKMVGLIIDEKI